MKILTMELPLYVILPRKTMKDRRVSINMNTYRNLHYLVSNAVKKEYKKYVEANLPKDCPKFTKAVVVIYHFQKRGNRKTDLMNWVSIADKFFLDSLVELGILPDDNTDYVNNYGIDFQGQTKTGKLMVQVSEE